MSYILIIVFTLTGICTEQCYSVSFLRIKGTKVPFLFIYWHNGCMKVSAVSLFLH